VAQRGKSSQVILVSLSFLSAHGFLLTDEEREQVIRSAILNNIRVSQLVQHHLVAISTAPGTERRERERAEICTTDLLHLPI
jgi:hypothetical protein